MPRDEYGIVLDFMPYGKPGDIKREPLAQIIGNKYFNLLEVVIKQDKKVEIKEKVYIGNKERDKVKYIKGRIKYDDLTSLAKTTLEEVLEDLITSNEQRLVKLFNIAGPITNRLHSLELLPGVGKKHLWKIIEERKNKPFESFEDIKKRIPLLPDPKKMIAKRLLEELKGTDKYRIIVGNPYI